MNQKIKRDWVRALKSGEYEQGKKLLFDGERYCCLGVLCDLFIKQHEGFKWECDNKNRHFVAGSGELTSVVQLPLEVKKWAELDSQAPSIEGKGSLVYMNDDMELSFKSIAELIEKSNL